MSQYNPVKEGAKAGAAGLTGCLTFVILGLVVTVVAVGLIAHGIFAAASPKITSPPTQINLPAIAPNVHVPATQSAPTQTATQVSCPAGYGTNSWGGCIDQRHLPCPAGYTGWQNTRLDNCLEKPSP